MKLRKITSLTALISFTLLLVTSVVLYIVPSGRIANWAGYRLWGLSKEDWSAVHTNLGVLLLLAMILHVYYNWKPMLSYMKNTARQLRVFTLEFNIALVLTLIVFLGTLAGIPPMSSIIQLGEAITDQANQHYGEPPYGHAELTPLAEFLDKIKVDPEVGLEALKKAGVAVEAPSLPLAEIAEDNNITPQRIYEIVKPVDVSDSSTDGGMPEEAPGGTGNRTLAQICQSYGLDSEKIVQGLAERGIKAEAGLKMKEIATANGIDPYAVYNAIYQLRSK